MRIKKLGLTIILICCSVLFLVGCKQESLAKSISLNGYSSENPLEFTMGNFSYNDYTVSVTYNDGEREEVRLTEDMISETDKLKFYQEGRNSITVTYKGAETSIEINVLRNKFPANIQLKNFERIYTGEVFKVEVEGDIPGGTKILYPQGNSFQNAGTYDMTAILQRDGYETMILSARVLIKKASYDVSNAQLYNETVVYNKDYHSIVVKGQTVEDVNGTILHTPAQLPQGVSVSYTITKVKDGKGEDIPAEKLQVVDGNKAVEAGTYKVCARFKGDESNYNTIPDSVAYLTVERATYNLSKIEFSDKTATYSGGEHALSIAENSKLPLDVVVSYQIKQLKDSNGDAVTDTYKDGNTAINVGVYSVKVIFNVNGKNAQNYQTAPLEKEALLTIRRASYDGELDKLYLDTQWEEFVENKTYEINFECDLPAGVTPQFELVDKNGDVIQGKMEIVNTEVEGSETGVKTIYKFSFTVETAGEYDCTVNFIHNNENYENIKVVLTATFYISSDSLE